MGLKFDLDPSVGKAVAIAICIFLLTFVAGVEVVVALGESPSEVQILASLCSATTATVTYLLGFLGYGKEETE